MHPFAPQSEPDRRSSSRKSGQLSPSDEKVFTEALDNPPAPNAKLKALMSNVVPLRPMHSEQIVQATRDWGAGWSPIDEDQETAEEALDLIHEWIWLAYGAVAALSFILIVLWARG